MRVPTGWYTRGGDRKDAGTLDVRVAPRRSTPRTLPAGCGWRDGEGVVFLDYDGTLTPIVARPELATLSAGMRETIGRLAARLPVAVVLRPRRGGRRPARRHRRPGVRRQSRARTSPGSAAANRAGKWRATSSPHLDAAEGELRRATARIAGVLVERKAVQRGDARAAGGARRARSRRVAGRAGRARASAATGGSAARWCSSCGRTSIGTRDAPCAGCWTQWARGPVVGALHRR